MGMLGLPNLREERGIAARQRGERDAHGIGRPGLIDGAEAPTCTSHGHNGDPAMSATARLVVQMTPEEKDALDQRARKVGLTTSEFVRRRIADDDLEEHRAEIEAFLTAIETTGPSIIQKLDSAISTATSMTAALEALGAKSAEQDRAAE